MQQCSFAALLSLQVAIFTQLTAPMTFMHFHVFHAFMDGECDILDMCVKKSGSMPKRRHSHPLAGKGIQGDYCAHISYRKIAWGVVCPSQTTRQLASAICSRMVSFVYGQLPDSRRIENLANNSGAVKALLWKHSRWCVVEGPLSKERCSRLFCQYILLCKCHDIVEAHCYVVITSESILMSRYVAESIKQLIAGCFGYVGLRELHTTQFCMQLKKAYLAETSCNQLFD